MLYFSLLAFAGYCGKLRKTVREGLIIRRSQVRILVGPPTEGRSAKIKFLKEFELIGDKYSRNLMMDVYHDEFRDYIAIDSRIKNISTQWNISTKNYKECEEFYRSVAKKAKIDCWTLDRLMYEFENVFYPPI